MQCKRRREISDKSDLMTQQPASCRYSFLPEWSTDCAAVGYPRRLSPHPRNTETDHSEIWSPRARFSLQIRGNHAAVELWGCGGDSTGFRSLILLGNRVWRSCFSSFSPVSFGARMALFSLSLAHLPIFFNIALQAPLQSRILKMENNYSN